MELLRNKQDRLKALNVEIAEREKYKRSQESQINELIESGNTELMSLVHDVAVARQELREVKTDLRLASREKGELNGTLLAIREEISISVTQTIFVGSAPAYG